MIEYISKYNVDKELTTLSDCPFHACMILRTNSDEHIREKLPVTKRR